MNNVEPFILAFETARRDWSVSLLRGAVEISHRLGNSLQTASEVLLTAVSSMLEESRISIKGLSAVAVSEGPGSFTGIRVGLATAQALAFGNKINCFGIPLFEALAFEARRAGDSREMFIVTDAGNSRLYWQSFSDSDDIQLAGSLPCLIDLDNFVRRMTEVGDHKKGSPAKAKIVTDKETMIKLEPVLHVLEVAANIELASDNVSKYVGLRCLEKIKNQYFDNMNFEATQDSARALYIRKVRIGQG